MGCSQFGAGYSGSRVRVQMEDEKAVFDELIVPLENQMMRTIWRVVRDGPLAEDTLQDALLIIWRNRDRIRRHPNPTACILRICRNCACDSLRIQQRQSRLQDSVRFLPLAKNPGPIGTRELEQKEVMTEVINAMGRLPQNQALAVLMRMVEEQSYAVIAESIGCSEITARIHFYRGRKSLLRRLAHLQTASSKES